MQQRSRVYDSKTVDRNYTETNFRVPVCQSFDGEKERNKRGRRRLLDVDPRSLRIGHREFGFFLEAFLYGKRTWERDRRKFLRVGRESDEICNKKKKLKRKSYRGPAELPISVREKGGKGEKLEK
ncbi:hypothetical protein GWI33_022141 [Rhynchophorus ferrugineus]|uniref:Uncharacterized protein n=1 Tax=Rhynchophorus ferrugineus TaxID=354439 RepID=A0A834MHZ4_RHYFE|nr:hypothetical protein GWI33_022141 [Rhynchophorus ferrugineus]